MLEVSPERHARIAVRTARQLHEEGRITEAAVVVDTTDETSHVFLHEQAREEDEGYSPWVLASARNPYEGKTFKSTDAALGACFKIGFEEVIVRLIS